MLDLEKLALLRQHAVNEDLIAAANVCVELASQSKGTQDEFFVEELELTVRLKDSERLVVIIDELMSELEQGPDHERS